MRKELKRELGQTKEWSTKEVKRYTRKQNDKALEVLEKTARTISAVVCL